MPSENHFCCFQQKKQPNPQVPVHLERLKNGPILRYGTARNIHGAHTHDAHGSSVDAVSSPTPNVPAQ